MSLRIVKPEEVGLVFDIEYVLSPMFYLEDLKEGA